MSSATDAGATEAPQLPFPRHSLLEVSPRYAELRGQAPAVRVRTPAGDLAWLLTRYEANRELWSDPRLGRSHPNPEQAARVSDAALLSGPMGDYQTEQADHARLRTLLTPAFSAKRMNRLSEHIESLVCEMLDGMVADCGPHGPADLQEHLSVPLPVFVICELLGVPYADRHYFRGLSDQLGRLSGGDPQQAAVELTAYLADVAATKRRAPGEDVLSDLVAAQRQHPDFDDQALAGLASGVLFAGHETTVNRINIGVLLLLANPRVRERLVAEPDTVHDVVEEILRLAAPGSIGIVRYAHQELTVGNPGEQVTIHRGEAVLLYSPSANTDERAFAEPDSFDPSRKPNPHLSFGHGAHFCIGASLARNELRAVFSLLFSRLPGLDLAVPPSELVSRHAERLTGGLQSLPVSW